MIDVNLPLILKDLFQIKFNQGIILTNDDFADESPILQRNWLSKKLPVIKWHNNTELNDNYFLEFCTPVLLEKGIRMVFIIDFILEGFLRNAIPYLYDTTLNNWISIKGSNHFYSRSDMICFQTIKKFLDFEIGNLTNIVGFDKSSTILERIERNINAFLHNLMFEKNKDLKIDLFHIVMDDSNNTHILNDQGYYFIQIQYTREVVDLKTSELEIKHFHISHKFKIK